MSKKVFSMFLVTLLVLFTFSIGFTAFAAENTVENEVSLAAAPEVDAEAPEVDAAENEVLLAAAPEVDAEAPEDDAAENEVLLAAAPEVDAEAPEVDAEAPDVAVAEAETQMTAGEKIKSFSFSKMFADIKKAAGNLNFIPWYTFYVDSRACDADGVEHIDEGWNNVIDDLKATGTSFGEFCAQYAAVMTNWAYTMAAIVGIIILMLKKNKKWWWYLFLVITAVMSVTSVGMHTADYGEFARYTMTTKLLASYVDMSFTELMAWSGCLCFIFEFYDTRPKQKKAFTIGVSVWALIVLAVLTFEVFVLNNRFLWIGGRGADGLPYDMGGDHGGLSLAEFGCFLTCLPLAYVLISNLKRLTKSERGIVVLLLGTFALAFVITSLWGDNEINFIAQGNFQGHSIWHLLTAMGTIIAAIWADHRTTEQQHKKEIEEAVQKALAGQK